MIRELPDDFEATKEFIRYKEIIHNNNEKAPIFITGNAGTGKSTFLSYLLRDTRQNIVILAPTGVAAVNVGGQTIHSFFRFPPRYISQEDIKYLEDWQFHESLSMIIIDEISMVRADMIDNIDYFLRINMRREEPFGGVQMVFIGDIHQLSPIVENDLTNLFSMIYKGPYFFNSHVIENIGIVRCELTHIFRQKDPIFIAALNKIRNGVLDSAISATLNTRIRRILEGDVITLTTTNKAADNVNTIALHKLHTKTKTYTAQIEGSFDNKYYPTANNLELKEGAQVMMLRNGGAYVNGTICKVVELREKSVVVAIENPRYDEDIHDPEDRYRKIEVTPVAWERIEYDIDGESIVGKQVGRFIQLPIKLAWAVTIHKSQGLTFDKVAIDLGFGSFAHGQTYVALSRCRSLEGITLNRPIGRRDIVFDKTVLSAR